VVVEELTPAVLGVGEVVGGGSTTRKKPVSPLLGMSPATINMMRMTKSSLRDSPRPRATRITGISATTSSTKVRKVKMGKWL